MHRRDPIHLTATFLQVAAFVGTVWLTAGCNRSDAANSSVAATSTAERGPLSWPLNQAHAYRLRMRSKVNAVGMASGIDLALSARVLLGARQNAGKAQLALTLSEARFEVPDSQREQYAQLARELQETYLVSMDSGVLHEERAPEGASPFAVSIFRTVASALQMGTGSPDAEGAWKTYEYDGTGKYLVEYRPREAGVFERRKLEYTPTQLEVKGAGPRHATFAPNVNSSIGSVRVNMHQLQQVSYQEQIGLAMGKGVVDGRTEFDLKFERSETNWQVKWQEAMSKSRVLEPGKPYRDANAEMSFDAQRVGNHTFDSALAALKRDAEARERMRTGERSAETELLPAQQRVRAFSAMTAILRTQPEARKRARAEIETAGPVASSLTDALASAGTPEAQALLVALLGGDKTKQAAASSLVRVQSPTMDAEEAIRALCHDTAYSAYCLYGLGTFARKLRESAQVQRAERIGKELVGYLQAAKTPAGQELALRGIANSGDVGAFPSVAKYLEDASATLRAAAVDATRLMPGAQVDSTLAKRLKEDSSVGARTAVVSAASVRARSAALTAAIVDAALHDTNSGVRDKAVTLLHTWLPESPELRSTLADVAAKDANEAVRKAALAALE